MAPPLACVFPVAACVHPEANAWLCLVEDGAVDEAGLVVSRFELSKEGKALNYYEASPFSLQLSPAVIAAAAQSLTSKIDP